MMKKIAKLWVNHASMTGDPSSHVRYLVDGHQLSTDEQAQVWTKSIPKACKNDNTALISHWGGIYDKFLEERQAKGSAVHHNAKVTARQFIVNLPNDITNDQVHHLAKAALADFPRHIPVAMVLHTKSNRGKNHMHLHGIFSYRNGGYGQINEQFRLNITKQMKETVSKALTGYGYRVDHGTPGSLNGKERMWFNQQGTVEQRRNPRYMKELAKTSTSARVRAYCLKQAEKMARRISAPSPDDETMQLMTGMTDLLTTYPKEKNSAQGQPSTDRPHGTTEPLTKESLGRELIKARQWNHTTKNSRSI
jgi:hypothetical protein